MSGVPLSKLGKAPRILLTRTDALGDLILSAPAFQALRQAYPEAHIAVLCRSYAAPVLEGNPAVNRVIEIESESRAGRAELARRLRSEHYDIALALYPSSFAADVLRRAGIPVRVGSARRFHSWKFTHRINHSRKGNTRSEAACNLELLAPLGINSENTAPEVFVKAVELERMQRRLAESVVASPFVALHPGSGGSALDWPLEKFVTLADQLRSRGIRSVFTGSADEAGMIAERAAVGRREFVSLAGKTDLRELAALLSLAEVVVANSTGPLHLAAAVGTGTIGLFPPARSMSPSRWAPPVDNTTVLMPEFGPCRCRNGRCRRQKSGGTCMESIPVESVLAKVIERLEALQAQ